MTINGWIMMKKRIVKALAGAIVATMILSGCNSALLSLDSDEDASTEENVEEVSEDKNNAASENTIEETVKDQEDGTNADSEDDITEDESNNDSKKAQDNVSDYDSAEMMDGDALYQNELDEFELFLDQKDNYGFTVSSFKDVEHINWGYVFAYGAGIENCEYSEEAVNAYLEASEYYDEVEYDLIALSGDDVRTFVYNKAGIADFDPSLVSGFVYVEEYDILFSQVSDAYDKDIYCQAGVRNGDLIQIEIKVGIQTNNRRITLKETGDSDNPYQFVSNRELWEENADQIIEAPIYQNTETITCAVLNTDRGLELEIINDNTVSCVAYLGFRISEDVDIEQYSDVLEIVFCDVDSDGLGDIVSILSDGSNSIAILCMGYVNEWDEGYAVGEVAVTEWLSENVSDMTADNVIGYILDHQDEFKDL